MGTIASSPQENFLLSKLNGAFDTTSQTQSSSDEEGHNGMNITGRHSPALIGREVLATSGNLSALPNQSFDSLDQKVLVNIPLADLMAYLQVVANHSQNLPLTKRDDPYVERMEFSISDEEYAKKSDAFIPADVRVIGGSFLNYTKVWDLPSMSEYSPSNGAQEPGRSYGGANCNALLKVLYDSAGNASRNGKSNEDTGCLFDEEEDSLSGVSPMVSFGSLNFEEDCNLPWVSLLRKMKSEIKELDFAQVPTISTSKKLDINQAFSIVPEHFDVTKGTKRSLLIGCNYENFEHAALKASHDDIRSIKDYIVTVHGFPEDRESMTMLLDDGEHQPPSYTNIIESFKRLSEKSQPGDVVFIQFSGHGSRLLGCHSDKEVDTYDEVIIPSDFQETGGIRDTLIFKTLLAPMQYGVTVTILIDSCDTGMMLDLPYAWSTRKDRSGNLAKMVQNQDFSFVRFLKVIKTLYESSSFTQVGNLVGAAIPVGPIPSNRRVMLDKIEGDDVSSLQKIPVKSFSEVSKKDSLFAACDPSQSEMIRTFSSQLDMMRPFSDKTDSDDATFIDIFTSFVLGNDDDGEDHTPNEIPNNGTTRGSDGSSIRGRSRGSGKEFGRSSSRRRSESRDKRSKSRRRSKRRRERSWPHRM